MTHLRPLRALFLLSASWVAIRMLWMSLGQAPLPTPESLASVPRSRSQQAQSSIMPRAEPPWLRHDHQPRPKPRKSSYRASAMPHALQRVQPRVQTPEFVAHAAVRRREAFAVRGAIAPQIGRFPATRRALSIDVWLTVSADAERTGPLAPMLGGSQAGARIMAPLTRDARLALTGLISAGLSRDQPVDLSLGLAIRPWHRVPLRLFVERRFAVRGTDRQGLIVTLAGGIDAVPLAPRLRLDAYGEAGLLGVRRTIGFADGALAVERQLGTIREGEVGLAVALRGAVQPGAARIDFAPMVVFRDDRLKLSAEWRARLGGSAIPRSGPQLTLAAYF